MTRTLVLPIAGKSSRFSSDLPKWAMKDKEGVPMVVASIQGIYRMFDRVIFIPLQEHWNEYVDVFVDIAARIKEIGFLPEFYPIDGSNSQPETVFKGLQKAAYAGRPIENFMVKDCDNFYMIEWVDVWKMDGNFVVYDELSSYPLMQAQNKSYITFDTMCLINNIVEKKVISSTFCVGGYGFESVALFEKAYFQMMKFTEQDGEYHLSHLIYAAMLHFSTEFYAVEANFFNDWGTEEDWNRYKGISK